MQENIKDLDFLTAGEIQSGSWTYESQLDPGMYYVLLRATDYDCIGQPTCLDGYSNMLTLNVPKPAQTYRGSVLVWHYIHQANLHPTARGVAGVAARTARDQERARGPDYPRAMGLHSRPDVEICRRLTGIRQLIGKAELIGVADEDNWILYAPLEA